MRARLLLGIPEPSWLWADRDDMEGIALFPSRTRLARRKTAFPKARYDFAIDSGGFTELKKFGRWRITAEEYAAEIRRYRDQLGPERMLWAAPQDNMCEPWVIYGANQHLPADHDDYFHGTRELRGLAPGEPEQDLDTAARIHIRLTVENFLDLKRIAPDLDIIPVLQGWLLPHYFYCKRLYEEAGIDLTAYPVVGIGSVCRRQDTDQIAEIVDALSATGLRLHGFGVKADGLALYGNQLVSADSQAWSYGHRRRNSRLAKCTHKAANCNYCLDAALDWYGRVKNTQPCLWRQTSFDFSAAA